MPRSCSALPASGCGDELDARRTNTCAHNRAARHGLRVYVRTRATHLAPLSCCHQDARGSAERKLIREVGTGQRLVVARKRGVHCGGRGEQLGARRHKQRRRLVDGPEVGDVVDLQELRSHVCRSAHRKRHHRVRSPACNQLQLDGIGRRRRTKARQSLRRCTRNGRERARSASDASARTGADCSARRRQERRQLFLHEVRRRAQRPAFAAERGVPRRGGSLRLRCARLKRGGEARHGCKRGAKNRTPRRRVAACCCPFKRGAAQQHAARTRP